MRLEISAWAFVILSAAALGGCAANSSQTEISESTQESEYQKKIPVSAEDIVPAVELIPVTELDSGDDIIKNTVKEISNWTVADSFVKSIPSDLDGIYSFNLRKYGRIDNELFYDEFKQVFEYLYPDRTMDENSLYYYGENSQVECDDEGNVISFLNLVKDYYEPLMSGEEDLLYFLYEERGEADRVFLECTAPVGNDLFNFNKGKAAKLAGISDDSLLETANPWNYFTNLGMYSADSEQTFKLSDKEIPIKDAVEFYKNYMNDIPSVQETDMKMDVTAVNVLDMGDGTYGYYMHSTISYKDIPFISYPLTVVDTSDGYDTYMSRGFMLESDDVDMTYGYTRMAQAEDLTVYTQMVSLEDAINLVAQSLTFQADFVLYEIDLAYQSDYVSLVGEQPDYAAEYTTTSWIFTLFNMNDGKWYVCQIDANSGQNFDYYTTSTYESADND